MKDYTSWDILFFHSHRINKIFAGFLHIVKTILSCLYSTLAQLISTRLDPALLLHTEDGFSALSLTCSHLWCTVEEKDQEFHCPCHGSGFNADGSVLNGPANQPLRTLKVELISDGTLVLYRK